MKGEWCYFKSYFDKKTCEEIINNALTIEPQDGYLGEGTDGRTDFSTRRSKVRFIQANDWRFSNLFNELWKTQISANRDFFNVHVTNLDYIQFAEYDESYRGEYKTHHDVFWVNSTSTHRKLSCVIQLSDPNSYVGGDFELVNISSIPPADDIRLQGTVIYFPSLFFHKANPVIRGKRYSIAAWFEGPEWR
jgi:PKHD-type hydroxylase